MFAIFLLFVLHSKSSFRSFLKKGRSQLCFGQLELTTFFFFLQKGKLRKEKKREIFLFQIKKPKRKGKIEGGCHWFFIFCLFFRPGFGFCNLF